VISELMKTKIVYNGEKMQKEKLSDQIYKKVAEKIDLEPLSDYSDLTTIHALDGREVGGFKAFKGDKLEKFSIAEFSLAPGMNYINVGLKPAIKYNIPRLGINYMVMTEKIQFDVDLYPAVDLVPRQDYIDKYYELLTDTYLKEKKAPYFNWRLSDRSWVRISASPKHPQSETGFNKARASVNTVKKVMNHIRTRYTTRRRYPRISVIPRTNSNAERKILRGSALKSRNPSLKALK